MASEAVGSGLRRPIVRCSHHVKCRTSRGKAMVASQEGLCLRTRWWLERSEATQREPGLHQTHFQADSGLRSKALPAAEESATATRKPNRINPGSRCIPLLPTLVVDLSRSCVIIGAAVHHRLKHWCLRLFVGNVSGWVHVHRKTERRSSWPKNVDQHAKHVSFVVGSHCRKPSSA